MDILTILLILTIVTLSLWVSCLKHEVDLYHDLLDCEISKALESLESDFKEDNISYIFNNQAE